MRFAGDLLLKCIRVGIQEKEVGGQDSCLKGTNMQNSDQMSQNIKN